MSISASKLLFQPSVADKTTNPSWDPSNITTAAFHPPYLIPPTKAPRGRDGKMIDCAYFLEPDAAMRSAIDRILAQPNNHSINHSAH
jgi:hypothetical protein